MTPTTLRLPLLLVLVFSTGPGAWAQKGRAEVAEGNRRFEEGEYDEARKSYRKALEQAPDSAVVHFNLGDSEYKLNEFSGAEERFREAMQATDPELLADVQYNLANSLFRQGRLEESIEAYKAALRLNPHDRSAKHNLEFALRQKQEQEQQQQQNQDPPSSEDQEESQDQEKSQDQESSSETQPESQPTSSQDPSEQPENQDQSEGDQENQEESPGQPEGDPEEENSSAQSQPEPQQEPADDQTGQSADARTEPDPEPGQLTKEEAARLLGAIQEDLRSLRRHSGIRKLQDRDRARHYRGSPVTVLLADGAGLFRCGSAVQGKTADLFGTAARIRFLASPVR